MGDDFKVVIKVKNQLRAILIWGDGYGGNSYCHSGNGKLIIKTKNKSRSQLFLLGTKVCHN